VSHVGSSRALYKIEMIRDGVIYLECYELGMTFATEYERLNGVKVTVSIEKIKFTCRGVPKQRDDFVLLLITL